MITGGFPAILTG